MTRLRAAVATEFLKSRRSRVPWGVAAGFSIAPLVMGLFMVILKDPEAARALGLLGSKAQLTAGTADWPTYWSLLGQAVTVGGSVLFAFLTAWVFGREFADRTVRGLLASATPRRTIVMAKALVVVAWGVAISDGSCSSASRSACRPDDPGNQRPRVDADAQVEGAAHLATERRHSCQHVQRHRDDSRTVPLRLLSR